MNCWPPLLRIPLSKMSTVETGRSDLANVLRNQVDAILIVPLSILVRYGKKRKTNRMLCKNVQFVGSAIVSMVRFHISNICIYAYINACATVKVCACVNASVQCSSMLIRQTGKRKHSIRVAYVCTRPI